MGIDVTTPVTRVLVQSVGGPAGPTGAPGQSTIQRVAASAMAAGQVVRTQAAGQQMAKALASLRTLPFDGLCLGDIQSGATGNYHVAGPVPANVLQLGAGVACAVGVDVNGIPVRATDPACVSAPNWLGTCDAAGNVTVGPRRSNVFNVLDFGATGNGVTDDTAAFIAAIATGQQNTIVVPGIGNLTGGFTVVVPPGVYVITQTLQIPNFCSIIGSRPADLTVLYCNIPPSPGVAPWGDAIIVNQGPTNFSIHSIIYGLAIYNARTGTAAVRAENGGSAIEIIGTAYFSVTDCILSGWKYGITVDAANATTIERTVFGGASLSPFSGYPSISEGYGDDVGLWLASCGFQAVITGIGANFLSIASNDQLILGFDLETSNVTVTFGGPQTIGSVVSAINAAANAQYGNSFVYASNESGQLRLMSEMYGLNQGRVSVIGGNAVSKCGLTIETVRGTGNGHGTQVVASGGLTNDTRVIGCQLGGQTNIWIEDGLTHVIADCIGEGGQFARVSSGVNTEWRNITAEGCNTDSVFLVDGQTVNLHIHSCVFQGFSTPFHTTPGTYFIKVVDVDGNINGLTIESVLIGSTGDGRAMIGGNSFASQINGPILVHDLQINIPVDMFELDPGNASIFSTGSQGSRGFIGVGTGNPTAPLDVRLSYSGVTPDSAMLIRNDAQRYLDISSDFTRWEKGQGSYVVYSQSQQQGLTEYFQKGEWASGVDPGLVLSIPSDDNAALALEIYVEMRSATGQGIAVWKFVRIGQVASAVAVIDVDTSQDYARTLGVLTLSGSWVAPTLGVSGRNVTVTVRSATTDFGSWSVYARVVARTAF